MSYSNLPSIFDKFDLFVSNYETEIELSDNEPSSASFFSTNTDLDISPLLFLRAPVAKIGLQHMTIENLCLCFLNKEMIKIHFSTPPDINYSNLVTTSDIIKEKNLSSFNLQFTDFSATSIEECLSYANELIEGNLSSYLVYRLSLNFFDLDIFKENIFENPASISNKITLSSEDIEILLRYTDFTLFTRRLFNLVLNGEDPTNLPSKSANDLIANLTYIKPKLTAALEKKILNKSEVLKSFDERKAYSDSYIFSTSNFEIFYLIDLKIKSTERRALSVKITTDFHNSLQTFFGINISDITPDNETVLSKLKTSNSALINQGLTLQKILLIQREKYAANFSPSLFTTELISIEKDNSGSKALINIYNKQFLPADESTFNLTIDPHGSYSLGCLPSSSIHIGPLKFASECQNTTKTTPRLTTNILSSSQRLHGPVRFHPKILNITCDILSTSDQKMLRPVNEDFHNFRSLSTIVVDENHFNTRFFCKNSDDIFFHRMLKTETLLQRFHIFVCDENDRQVHFPRNSIFTAKLVIAPCTTEFDH